MVLHYWQPGDIVLFADTGREHTKTYKFINDFEAFENIPVTRCQMFEGADSFGQLLAKGDYKSIPNQFKRFCTDQLKIKTAKRYLRSIGVREFDNFVGFRADEPQRVNRRKQKHKKVHDRFPLYDDGITKEMITHYWSTKPYTLEIPAILGNCTLCFMKGQNAIMAILREFPELAEPWINDETEAQKHGKFGGHTYFPNTTIQQLKDIAQNNLFKDYPLEQLAPAYNCACTT